MAKTVEEKWLKAKKQLQKATAKEWNLRQQVETQMIKAKEDKHIYLVGDENITFTRRKNYSIPKAAIVDIQTRIPKDVFNSAFTTSYKLKAAVYDNLSGDCKKAITDHLTIKDSPLSVSIKEI